MLEKIKKNWNEWYAHSLGMIILAICVVLNGYTEISFALYGLSVVLLGIGALYNESKKKCDLLLEISNNQKFILEELKK